MWSFLLPLSLLLWSFFSSCFWVSLSLPVWTMHPIRLQSLTWLNKFAFPSSLTHYVLLQEEEEARTLSLHACSSLTRRVSRIIRDTLEKTKKAKKVRRKEGPCETWPVREKNLSLVLIFLLGFFFSCFSPSSFSCFSLASNANPRIDMFESKDHKNVFRDLSRKRGSGLNVSLPSSCFLLLSSCPTLRILFHSSSSLLTLVSLSRFSLLSPDFLFSFLNQVPSIPATSFSDLDRDDWSGKLKLSRMNISNLLSCTLFLLIPEKNVSLPNIFTISPYYRKAVTILLPSCPFLPSWHSLTNAKQSHDWIQNQGEWFYLKWRNPKGEDTEKVTEREREKLELEKKQSTGTKWRRSRSISN